MLASTNWVNFNNMFTLSPWAGSRTDPARTIRKTVINNQTCQVSKTINNPAIEVPGGNGAFI